MTTAAPDRSSTTQEVQCPLCDYNLRGLTQPLCPECGHGFDWPDLLDPRRKRHEYLFEHQVRRPIPAFFKTITRRFRPGRFWRTVYPSQPVNTRRLIVYWSICSIVALLPTIAAMLASSRTLWARAGPPPIFFPPPTPTRWEFIWYFLLHDKEELIFVSTAAALYPLLCGLTLLLFHQSMRNAHVKPRYAMRAAIYSGDIVFWYGLWLMGLALAFGIIQPDPFLDGYYSFSALIAIGAIAVVLITSLRMRAAYHHYMRLPHPAAIMAVTQLIVLLLILLFMPFSVFAGLYEFLR